MRPFIVLLLAIGACACAHTPPAGDPAALFDDAAFAPPAAPVPLEQVFAVSPAMREYLATAVAPRVRDRGPPHGLMEALREDLRIEYDAAVTRTAAETFEARAGNCLSLTIMAAALARELDVPVRFQLVTGYDAWSRSGGFTLRSRHVNLVLGSRPTGTDAGNDLVVDFVPPGALARLRASPVPPETVLAMFLNNRAAEALVEGDLDGAYWHVRAAARAAPVFMPSYNTLGIVYLRHGMADRAEQAFRHVLAREPAHLEALMNLALALERQGREADAAAVREQVAGIQQYPPFHFLDAGLAALERGDARRALSLFLRELARLPYDDEVHMAIAVASLRLGDVRRARRHLLRALENGPTRERRAIYAARLEAIEALDR